MPTCSSASKRRTSRSRPRAPIGGSTDPGLRRTTVRRLATAASAEQATRTERPSLRLTRDAITERQKSGRCRPDPRPERAGSGLRVIGRRQAPRPALPSRFVLAPARAFGDACFRARLANSDVAPGPAHGGAGSPRLRRFALSVDEPIRLTPRLALL